jgi:hypothetical protein
MTTAMYGQPMTTVPPYGNYPFASGSQFQPYLQPQQQIPFGGLGVHPFAQQTQSYGMPLQQILQTFAQHIGQLNQHNQQQSQLLQQLTQTVPQQLQQIQQFLQFLPQVIQQSQLHQQPSGHGVSGFGPWQQQPFGGSSTWAGAGLPPQGLGGQGGIGGNLGIPSIGPQSGLVM